MLPAGTHRLSKSEQFAVLRARINDRLATGTTDQELEFLLERAATLVNAARRDVVRRLSVTIPARQFFIQLSEVDRRIGRVLRVMLDERDLDEVDWWQCVGLQQAPLEPRTERPETWSMVGGDMLMIWPVQSAETVITLVYTPVIDLADLGQFEDRSIGAVLDVTEALLLVRQRDVAGLAALMERL